MKCLSIQQPWASLICGGIKDVENRSWRVNDAPGRILIHAGKTMRPMGELPTFFGVLIDNAIASGYVPEVEDLPLGAIIGYADIVGFTEECTSDWAQEGHGAEWKWKIENAKLFKSPIPYRGRQGLFEVPEIEADNLPEAYDFPKLARRGTILDIPVNGEVFNTLDTNKCFTLFLTEKNRSLFTDDELVELHTDAVVFHDSRTGNSQKFVVDQLVVNEEVDENNEPALFFDPNGNELYLYTINIFYK